MGLFLLPQQQHPLDLGLHGSRTRHGETLQWRGGFGHPRGGSETRGVTTVRERHDRSCTNQKKARRLLTAQMKKVELLTKYSTQSRKIARVTAFTGTKESQ